MPIPLNYTKFGQKWTIIYFGEFGDGVKNDIKIKVQNGYIIDIEKKKKKKNGFFIQIINI